MDEAAGEGFPADSSLAPPPADGQDVGRPYILVKHGKAKKGRPDPSPPPRGGHAAPAHSTRSRSAAGEHGRA
jgi:hypothetical protein